MNVLASTIGDYQAFLQTILGKVKAAGFDMGDFAQLDHMGYRAPSLEIYEQKKCEMQAVATKLGEIIVNDRPIATFRLRQPILFDTWRVDAIEVIAPREGKPMPQGLDHVEFVLFDDLQMFLQKYADKEFNLAAADRGINPEVVFELGDHQAVKFHLLNLPTVVYLEKKLGISSVKSKQ